MQRKKIFPIHKALDHFDDFYAKVFDKKWTSIRHGLLGKPKYIAVVNNYSDSHRVMTELENSGCLNIRTMFNLQKQYNSEQQNKIKKEKHLREVKRLDKQMEVAEMEYEMKTKAATTNEVENKNYSLEKSLSEAEIDNSRLVDANNALSAEILYQYVPATKIKGVPNDWVAESDHYKYYDVTGQFQIETYKEYDLHFPEHLNVYCFETDNLTKIPSATLGSTRVLDYYLMDGGSLLPVLALNLKPGNKVLDMCASPGGKSLLAIQTLYPDVVVCNDVSYSRVDRLYKVFKEYLYDLNERWIEPGRLKIMQSDARQISIDNFDRILVDVPCTTDRHSVKENENNIFKSSRIKERLKLPELQCELLVHALKLVKVGGVVVYSTCSLSPIQNDGVVHMALKRLWEETNIKAVVW